MIPVFVAAGNNTTFSIPLIHNDIDMVAIERGVCVISEQNKFGELGLIGTN